MLGNLAIYQSNGGPSQAIMVQLELNHIQLASEAISQNNRCGKKVGHSGNIVGQSLPQNDELDIARRDRVTGRAGTWAQRMAEPTA